jgi:hypothetical protein
VSGPIAPALTPEEWAEDRVRLQAIYIKLVPGSISQQVFVHATGKKSNFGIYTDEEVVGFPFANSRHIIAALALRDQPFGFTWERVDTLKLAASYLAAAATTNPGRLAEYDTLAEELQETADLIAALLPPRVP